MGGGPAGLAAAYRLSEDPTRSVLVLERAPRLGGLAAGMERRGMRLDFGPHRLHASAHPEVLADLRALLGSELEEHERHGRIRIHGRYLPFPPTLQTVAGLGPSNVLRIGAGMVTAKLRSAQIHSYEDAVARSVGRPLYELFYGPYAEKVWGLPGRQIAVEQAERRVNQRGPLDFLRMLSGGSASRRFLYPRGGFGRIPGAYADALRRRPNVEIHCRAPVTSLELAADKVFRLEYIDEDAPRVVLPEHVVWTAPLSEVVRGTAGSPSDVREAAQTLRARAVVIAYAQVARPYVGRADTYYFPERNFPFNRVTEQKRFSPDTVPGGQRTVLVMDVACDIDSARFATPDETLREELGAALERACLCARDEIIDFWTVRFRSAYPIYSLDTSTALAKVREWTDSIANLWLVGRQGLFLHNNTHHSLLMGYRAAAAINDGANRQAWLQEVESFTDFTVAD